MMKITKEKKDIPRCEEHGLYLYFNGETKQGQIIATCKLGCCEFWDKIKFYKKLKWRK